jgi:hypothetical protein
LKQVRNNIFDFLKSIKTVPLDKNWLNLQFINNHQIKKPDELENGIVDPPGPIDEKILDKIQGSLIGLALGDALGAHVEFRPRQYLLANPVNTLEGGGTWGLKQGQVLCLHPVLNQRKKIRFHEVFYHKIIIS